MDEANLAAVYGMAPVTKSEVFNMAFIASMIVGRTPRGDDMFFAMLEGGADMIMDHQALEILAAEAI